MRNIFLFAALAITGGSTVFISSCKKEADNKSTATCSDGIKNQNETGIDCGGVCPACAVSLCADGILNQGETFVDCGGPCGACPSIFINGKLDGVPFHFSNPSQSGPQDGSLGYWGTNNSTFDAGGIILGGGEVEMIQGRLNNTSYPTIQEYIDLYAPGTYGYYNYSNMTATHGCSVAVLDANDASWSTYGTDNTGNTITITSRTNWTPGSTYIIFQGNFSCNVKCFDSVGITKVLTGSFSMYGYVKPF